MSYIQRKPQKLEDIYGMPVLHLVEIALKAGTQQKIGRNRMRNPWLYMKWLKAMMNEDARGTNMGKQASFSSLTGMLKWPFSWEPDKYVYVWERESVCACV